MTGYQRDPGGTHPPLLTPEYASTVLRAPNREPVVLAHSLTEITGPLLGEGRVGPTDHDLTRQHDGEPMGERIIVHGRVLDSDGRAVPDTLVELWQANSAGRYAHAARPAPGAARPELHRRRPVPDRLVGAVPVRHAQAGRLPVAQPRERLAREAHALLAVRPGVRAAAGDPDVLPRGPAVRPGPDLQRGARGRPAPHDLGVRPVARPCRSGRSPTGSTSCCGAATRRRWRRSGPHAFADGRPVLLARADLAGRPVRGRRGHAGRLLAARRRCSTAPARWCRTR